MTTPAAVGRRLTGLDAARGLALLGMMAAHIMPLYDGGSPTVTGSTVSGRSAALFAVLAGVGLSLYSGKTNPHSSESLAADRRGLGTRALIIAMVGFSIATVPASIAVILVHYAVLFLLALPFLGLSVRPLALWAAGWLLLSPLVAYLIRPLLYQGVAESSLGHNPAFTDLISPVTFATDIFFTGYYPAVQWLGYILVGMLIGRLPLGALKVQLGLVVFGTVGAVAAWVLAHYLIFDLRGVAALEATTHDLPRPLETMLQVSLSPVEQTGSWWWLLTAAPHSGTTLDLLHTSAVAVAIIGVCLLLTRRRPLALLPLSGAGAMTLTLYTGHIIALGIGPAEAVPLEPAVLYWIYTVLAMLIGAGVYLARRRGPLEVVASTTAAFASRKTPSMVR